MVFLPIGNKPAGGLVSKFRFKAAMLGSCRCRQGVDESLRMLGEH